MSKHSTGVALTLYEAGTLTREQAARRAGVSEERFARICRRNGVRVVTPEVAAGGPSPANAD